MFSTHLPSQSLAKGGLIKSIINFVDDIYKGGKDIIKSGTVAIRNFSDEALRAGVKSKTNNQTISPSSVEAKITENVSREHHTLNFSNLKNAERGKYIKDLKSKFTRGDDVADVADFFDIDD